MPELPEVETVVRGLARGLPGRVVSAVDLRRTDIIEAGAEGFAARLVGRAVSVVRRRGKNILIGWGEARAAAGHVPGPPLSRGGEPGRPPRPGHGRQPPVVPSSSGGDSAGSPALWLRVNLGMTGRLCFDDGNGAGTPHTHVRWQFADGGAELHFRDPRRFGGLWLLEGADPEVHPGLAELGPEPLTVTDEVFAARLRGRRPVKSALLDQRVVAGVGNIYADEALHRAGVHPSRHCDRLRPAAKAALRAAVAGVLARAIECGGSSIRDYISADGEAGWFQVEHAVYGREGEACRTCGAAIQRMVIGGRSSHYCPRCQPMRGGR